MKRIRAIVATVSASLLVSVALLPFKAHAQQVQCASQFGAGNIAQQIQNSIFTGGGTVPLYQNQCLGQVGNANTAGQLQSLSALGLPGYAASGNYPLPSTSGGQGLLQLGDNNWALQQTVNLILPPTLGGLNISSSEANPTSINNNYNYLINNR